MSALPALAFVSRRPESGPLATGTADFRFELIIVSPSSSLSLSLSSSSSRLLLSAPSWGATGTEMIPLSTDCDGASWSSTGSPVFGSFPTAGGVMASVVSSMGGFVFTTPGRQRSSPSRSAETELAPLRRAGSEGSD